MAAGTVQDLSAGPEPESQKAREPESHSLQSHRARDLKHRIINQIVARSHQRKWRETRTARSG
jgi:hypothetical protein